MLTIALSVHVHTRMHVLGVGRQPNEKLLLEKGTSQEEAQSLV